MFIVSVQSDSLTTGKKQSMTYIPLFRKVLNDTVILKRRLSDYFYSAPTAGETRILGYFYALVYIGSPSQRTTLIIDTGSSICSTPCLSCKNCGNHLNVPFNPKLSKSIQAVACDKSTNHMTCSSCKDNMCYFTQRYLEGSSMSGPVYRDHMWLGGNVFVNNSHIPIGDENSLIKYSVKHSFGCAEKVTGLFSSQLADGIIGLAPRPNSYITDLFSQRPSIYKSFSLCFENNGGLIVFGGHDRRLDLTPMCYIPLHTSTGYYRVMISSVSWNTQVALTHTKLWNKENGILVDSGTSFTYLYSKAFDYFMDAFKMEAKRINSPVHKVQFISGENICYSITPAEFHLFPVLYLIFESGCRYHIAPDDYFFYKPRFNVYCMGIYSDPSTVIGNNIMNNHHFLFDIKQQQLGISEAKCSTKATLKQDNYDLSTKYMSKPMGYRPSTAPIYSNLLDTDLETENNQKTVGTNMNQNYKNEDHPMTKDSSSSITLQTNENLYNSGDLSVQNGQVSMNTGMTTSIFVDNHQKSVNSGIHDDTNENNINQQSSLYDIFNKTKSITNDNMNSVVNDNTNMNMNINSIVNDNINTNSISSSSTVSSGITFVNKGNDNIVVNIPITKYKQSETTIKQTDASSEHGSQNSFVDISITKKDAFNSNNGDSQSETPIMNKDSSVYPMEHDTQTSLVSTNQFIESKESTLNSVQNQDVQRNTTISFDSSTSSTLSKIQTINKSMYNTTQLKTSNLMPSSMKSKSILSFTDIRNTTTNTSPYKVTSYPIYISISKVKYIQYTPIVYVQFRPHVKSYDFKSKYIYYQLDINNYKYLSVVKETFMTKFYYSMYLDKEQTQLHPICYILATLPLSILILSVFYYVAIIKPSPSGRFPSIHGHTQQTSPVVLSKTKTYFQNNVILTNKETDEHILISSTTTEEV